MKRTVTYILSILMLCVTMLLPVETAYAANISISASKSSVGIGDSVTVTITVPENISGTLDVIYPADLLEFSKASAEVNSSKAGTVAVSIGKYGLVTSNKLTITFKAKTAGEATVKAKGIDFFDNNGESDTVTLGDSSTKITIKNETEQTELSSDYYLSKLNITAGSKKVTLSPAFSYRKTNYTATVDYDVTDVVVSASLSSKKAELVSMTDNGKVKLNVGENKVEITVKAENGKTLTYAVTITRKDKPADTPVDPPVTPDPPTPATPDFEYGGNSLYVVETPDNKIPTGFVEKTVILSGGKEVLGLFFEKADLTVLYMENDNKAGSFYIYNAQENSIYPFVKLSSEENFVIVLMAADEEAPQNYNACTLSIEGKGVVNAYQLQSSETVDMSDFYLVYCVNHNGTKGWYQYDSLEGTYQRFVGTVVLPDVDPGTNPGTTEKPGNPQNPQDPDVEIPGGNNPGGDKPGDNTPVDKLFNWEEYKTIIICAGVFLAAVLVIIVINIILAATRKATAGEEDDDDEDDDDEYEYFDDKTVFKRTPQLAKEKLSEEGDTEEKELPKIDIGSVLEEDIVEESSKNESVENESSSEMEELVEETETSDTSDGDEVEFLDL